LITKGRKLRELALRGVFYSLQGLQRPEKKEGWGQAGSGPRTIGRHQKLQGVEKDDREEKGTALLRTDSLPQPGPQK